jgi:hypothetical protein
MTVGTDHGLKYIIKNFYTFMNVGKSPKPWVNAFRICNRGGMSNERVVEWTHV